MSTTFSSNQSPLVGKYMYVDPLEFFPRGESCGYECYCISFNNNIYTVRNKWGKEFNATIGQIKRVIDITERQKFSVGDIVEAKVEYYQKEGDWRTEYCQVVSVKNFANDYDYVLKNVQTGQTYNLSQQSIIKIVHMLQNKYQVGAYVGVTHVIGPQWDYEKIIKNATIVKVNPWYNRVTYEIKYDNGEVGTILEDRIVAPGVPKVQKTPDQIKSEQTEFLRSEEQRLLQQLEMVRAARARVQ